MNRNIRWTATLNSTVIGGFTSPWATMLRQKCAGAKRHENFGAQITVQAGYRGERTHNVERNQPPRARETPRMGVVGR